MINHELSLQQFSEQIRYALEHFTERQVTFQNPANIVICGLGGSGIGGRIASGYFKNTAHCPIQVVSDYSLPAYVNEQTLVILSSYSGNTEETLQMFAEAQKRKAQIVGITSGGTLKSALQEAHLPYFEIPVGYQPRMALGFSLSFCLLILGKICNQNTASELEEVLLFYNQQEACIQVAQNICELFSGQPNQPFLVICDEATHGVAVRFCQQIQENAKGQAFALVLPECNHNFTESIYGSLQSHILFLNSKTHPRNTLRFDFLQNLLNQNQNQVVELAIQSGSLPELFKAIYILDWLSILLSNKKNQDNMQVPNIDQLKTFLKEHVS